MEVTVEVCLHIERQIFTVKKDLLCEHSDYFRAMFSGSYVEKEQHDITIDVIDANSMSIILRYMEMGLIDLSEYDLPVIGCLAVAANFLQITELIKQIEYCLDLQITLSNWVETLAIAQNAAYTKLQRLSAAFGLLSFKSMKPEYIPTIDKLFWYLSHPYLDVSSELHVFQFGFQWTLCREIGVDALLIILGCLDLKNITLQDLEEIRNIILNGGFANSLPEKVVECLLRVRKTQVLSVPVLTSEKDSLCKMFTERVYAEVLNLVRESKRRKLNLTPVVPTWETKGSKLQFVPHFMYKFSVEKGFEKWLEVADKNLWGWSVVSWGANKLVIVCGELGRGTGSFMKDVKVYDTLRNEWICHGVQLPPRRHGGVTILGDSMFLIGGVGGFRVTLDTAITYDMKERSYRSIAKLPDPIQCPAICTHKGLIYTAGQKRIYMYDDLAALNTWCTILQTEMRMNRMTSFKDYIYCSQNYFSMMYRFRPGFDDKLEHITTFSHPAAAICTLNDRLLVFTKPTCYMELISVEEYRGNTDETPKLLWTNNDTQITVNDFAGGSCALVVEIPPLHTDVSQYHQKYISSYTDIDVHYNK